MTVNIRAEYFRLKLDVQIDVQILDQMSNFSDLLVLILCHLFRVYLQVKTRIWIMTHKKIQPHLIHYAM